MFEGKKILIIGGTGSIGRVLTEKVLSYNPNIVRIFSRDEYKQFLMQQELSSHNNIRYLIGDVRDKERLDRAMNDIDIVFNLAALKHVPACEYNPIEAVKTNVIGTQNVIECAIGNKVNKVIYTSSDKAVSPTNTMGATKLLAERLMSSADSSKGAEIPVFASVRFGNVLGSRGSVVPLWEEQIEKNQKITITDPEMTRFMMNLKQATQLLIKTVDVARGGEVFVLKMPILRLGDLAEVVVENKCKKMATQKGCVEIEHIGLRPGEKLFEELMTEHESLSAIEYEDMFAILPYHKINEIDSYGAPRAQFGEYSSSHAMRLNKEEIYKLLEEANLL